MNWKLLFMLTWSGLWITTTTAQDSLLQQTVTLDLQNVYLHKALDELSNQTNYNFTYDTDLFDNQRQISINVIEEPLIKVLNRLLPDSTLKYHVVDRQIVISSNHSNHFNSTSKSSPKSIIAPKQIKGRILDKNSQNPLPYATLGIKGKFVGSISNMDGKFELKIPHDNFNDTLIISYVGYQNRSIPINEISNSPITIMLIEEHVSLQEVIIRNTDPVSLIRAAMRQTTSNYLHNPCKLTTFYRESVKKNRHYMIYLEAILNIYKHPYNTPHRVDLPKIFKSRKIYDANNLDTVSLRLKGGVNGCLMLDIIKNRPDFLKEEFLDYFIYNLEDISVFNNHPVYIINFAPKKDNKVTPLEGRIYLDTRTLALIKAEFGYSSQIVGKIGKRFILKKKNKTKVKPIQISYRVSYRQLNERYYLNHAQGLLKFRVRKKQKLFSSVFETSFEMATTQIDTLDIYRFKSREVLKPNTVFSKEQIIYDPDFWGNHSFIHPEENIEDALRRISSSIQQTTLEKKEE